MCPLLPAQPEQANFSRAATSIVFALDSGQWTAIGTIWLAVATSVLAAGVFIASAKVY